MSHCHVLHGLAASGAAIILAAGTKGKRFALPHSKIMPTSPWGQVGGQVSDIEIQANEILKDRRRLNEMLSHHTAADRTDRERNGNAIAISPPRRPKEFGLVDDVLVKLADEKKDKK